jgi:GNAT superfamily N-acetyltransferase
MSTDAVRAIAENPFAELDLGVLFRRHDLGEVVLCSSRWPTAAVVVPKGEGVKDVPAAVAAARAAARELGDTHIAWWIPSRHDDLVAKLEEFGIAQGDAPGFESVETAMALETAPDGGAVDGVDVRVVETFEDFTSVNRVLETAFGLPPTSDDDARVLFEDYSGSANTGREYLACVGGQAVGAAFGVPGRGALNLFGGGVLPEARGQGVYRALVWARWEHAVRLGAPALTVQAGRQSAPILERLGFRPLADIRMFVDTLDSPPS